MESSNSSSLSSSMERDLEAAETMMDLRDRMPRDQADAEKAEKALGKELEKLSMAEREKILFDIHGVSDNQMDDDTLESKLQALQQELDRVEEKAAYDRACQLDRSYVEDKAFRLMALRAEEFNVQKAAKHLVFHFQVKQELFVRKSNTEDDGVLVRDVTWDDLDEDDKLVVKAGYCQVGSKRDASGRAIFFIFPSVAQPSMTADSLSRAQWYVFMSATLDDAETKKKGAVLVLINIRDKVFPLDTLRQIVSAYACLPFTTSAFHFAYQNPALHLAVVGIRLVMYSNSYQQALRFRSHFGNLEKITFELLTFGIPMDCCPLQPAPNTGSPTMSLGWHLEWLQVIQQFERKTMEEKRKRDMEEQQSSLSLQDTSASEESGCIIPRRSDVLFGRSKMAREHPGTLRCHHLVHTYQDVYEQTSRYNKTDIADQVASIIRDSDGRFLEWEKSSSTTSGFWVVVPHDVARDRISHMFRRLREVKRGKRNWYLGKDNDTTSSSGSAREGLAAVAAPATKKIPCNRDPEESDEPRQKQRKPTT